MKALRITMKELSKPLSCKTLPIKLSQFLYPIIKPCERYHNMKHGRTSSIVNLVMISHKSSGIEVLNELCETSQHLLRHLKQY